MKRKTKIIASSLLLLGTALAAGILGLTAKPKKAYCAYCAVEKCYGAYGCGIGCNCLMRGGSSEGTCWSINYAIPDGFELMK